MAKFVSLGNVVEDVKRSFKEKVNPMDVLVGALAAQLGGRYVGAYIKRAVAAKNSDGTPSANPPATTDTLKTALWDHATEIGQAGIGLGLAVVQKGSPRGAGHLIGALGIAVTGVASKQLAASLPAPDSLKAYLSADFIALGRSLGVVVRSNYGSTNRMGVITRSNYGDDFDDRQQDMLALGRMSEDMDRIPEAPMYG